MCTVTWLPLSDGFILTSNRDERINRPLAKIPAVYAHEGMHLLYPKDPQAGGTWIAAGETGTVLCLLNGAREKHTPKQTYRQSRGQILLDFWAFDSAVSFAEHYNFQGIEPFTLVIASRISLSVLRWNEMDLEWELPEKKEAHIWSSATLYTPETVQERQRWFKDWKASRSDFSQTDILNFHRFGGAGDPGNDLVMQRSDHKQTVSISSVAVQHSQVRFLYHDLVSNQFYSEEMAVFQSIA